MKENTSWNDERVEMIMGNLLIIGVICSAAIAITGGMIFLFKHGFEPTNYHIFHGEPSDLRSVGGVISQALTWHGRGIIQFGLLLLVLTPIARVIFSVFAFFKEKDNLYVAVNLIVLAFLLFSLVGGVKL